MNKNYLKILDYKKIEKVFVYFLLNKVSKFMRINCILDHYSRNELFDTMTPYFSKYGSKIVLHFVFTHNETFSAFLNHRQTTTPKIKEEKVEMSFEDFRVLFLYSIQNEVYINQFHKNEVDIDDLIGKIENNQLRINEEIIKRVNQGMFGVEFTLKNKSFNFNENNYEANKRNIVEYSKCYDEDIIEKPELCKEYQDDDAYYKFRVFNVGQANCSALLKMKENDDYDVVAVFDLGYEEGKITNYELNSVLGKIDNRTTIVISHFDSDHINNVVSMNQYATNRWVIPDHEPKVEAASIFYQALLAQMTAKSYSGAIYRYSVPMFLSPYFKISQNQTGRHEHFQSSQINADCMISSLLFNNTKILIPGDALYRDFPKDIFDYEFDYILVPHHCCRYEPKGSSHRRLIEKIEQITKNDPLGIVMCGTNNHGHANNDHLSWYKNHFLFRDSVVYNGRDNVVYTINNHNQDFYEIDINKH